MFYQGTKSTLCHGFTLSLSSKQGACQPVVFSQPFFIFCFLPIALLLYYCTGGSVLCMLTISLLFYACGATESVVLLLLLSLVTVILCITMEKTENPGHRRALLLLGIIMNGGALFYYKYFGFFVRQLSLFVPTLSLQNWSDAAMPLGISFFSFKAISLLADVYRRTVSLEGRLLPGLSYLSFFGHIQSGPIARFGGGGWDIQRQLPSWEAFCNGLQRFAVGLAKKAILADSLAKIANNAFAVSPDSLSTGLAWLGAVSYALQLYYDFSGYSDMAIGLTGMFGFTCGENFNYPYMSASISEFWRRWHISLGAWFRDYIYFPLGGSRVKSRTRLFFNLLAVWLLTGLWHGANWTFVCWGLFYWILVALEKATGLPQRLKRKLTRGIYRLLCLVFIVFLWVLFRSPSLHHALLYIRAMVLHRSVPIQNLRAAFLLRDNWFFLLAGMLFCFPIIPWCEKRLANRGEWGAAWGLLLSAGILLVFLWGVSFIIAGSNNPFLYANF
ncbi:MAG: MBOAT family protein [Clostridia bacterium]|nr:MBOAT family protein [Clostridia bacterium]